MFLIFSLVWRLDLGTAAETSCCGAATNRGSSLPSSSASECRSPDAVGEKGVHRRLIKEATFRMGSDRPKIVGDFEGPSRLVSVKSFEIDAYEATNAEFGEFVDATGYVTDSEKYGWSFVFHLETDERERLVKGVEWWVAVNGSYWREPRGPGTASESNLPAVQVSWNDAEAFCRWRQGRLPTEAEWEMAARDGRSGELFPWGNELLGEDRRHRANVWQGDFPTYNNEEDGFAFAAPVGSFPPQTQSGLHDMIGNVWEWVQDDWNDPSFTSSATTRTTTTKAAEDDAVVEKVKKGGSYLCHRSYCYRYRSAARHKNSADSASSNQGVRCAYDV